MGIAKDMVEVLIMNIISNYPAVDSLTTVAFGVDYNTVDESKL